MMTSNPLQDNANAYDSQAASKHKNNSKQLKTVKVKRATQSPPLLKSLQYGLLQSILPNPVSLTTSSNKSHLVKPLPKAPACSPSLVTCATTLMTAKTVNPWTKKTSLSTRESLQHSKLLLRASLNQGKLGPDLIATKYT